MVFLRIQGNPLQLIKKVCTS